jgi:lipoprotein-releasing system permease protein
MQFAFLVALSHLKSRRNDSGISVITFVSIVGVTVGVTALIMVLAVMEGFELDLRDKILGSNAHLVVLNHDGNFADYDDALEKIDNVPGVASSAPFVYSEMMIRSPQGASGVVFKGIDLQRTPEVTNLVDYIEQGPEGPTVTLEQRQQVLQNLKKPEKSEDEDVVYPGILIGKELARELWLGPKDTVHIINPVGGGIGPMGMPTPDVRTFRIAGIFHTGMYEYDTKWTYVILDEAQEFLKMPEKINGIEAQLNNIDEAPKLAQLVSKELGYPFFIRHWMELNSKLFLALKMEKIVMGLILSLIVMVASLNIVGTLILVVLTRGREISILRAMGASSKQILQVFILEGVIIGCVGTLTGTLLGLIGCYFLDQYQFPLDTDVYYMDTLPVVVELNTVLIVAFSAILISFLATIYPAITASKMDPVEGLRYE